MTQTNSDSDSVSKLLAWAFRLTFAALMLSFVYMVSEGVYRATFLNETVTGRTMTCEVRINMPMRTLNAYGYFSGSTAATAWYDCVSGGVASTIHARNRGGININMVGYKTDALFTHGDRFACEEVEFSGPASFGLAGVRVSSVWECGPA